MSKKIFFAKLIAPFTRRIRFPGRERLLRSFFPPDHFRKAGSFEFVIAYDRDLYFRCDLGSYLEWSIFFKGYYVPDLSILIKNLIKPGMQIVDVGANVGAYTLIMAKQTGSTGKVIAFEPNPEVSQRLEHNIRLNHFEDRVSLIPFALSDREGELTLYVPRSDEPHRGISSLYKYVNVLTDQIKVEVKPLDNIFANLGLNRLDFLKIDTEGYDTLILKGSMKTIRRFLPSIIFENNYLANPDVATINEVRNELESLGYRFFTIGYFGKLRPCPPGKPLPDSDIVCIPVQR